MSEATIGWLWFIYYMGVPSMFMFFVGGALARLDPKKKSEPIDAVVATLCIAAFSAAWPIIAGGMVLWVFVEVLNALTARKAKA